MSDFMIKAALITFGFVPMGALALLFVIGCVIGMMESENGSDHESKS